MALSMVALNMVVRAGWTHGRLCAALRAGSGRWVPGDAALADVRAGVPEAAAAAMKDGRGRSRGTELAVAYAEALVCVVVTWCA